MTQPQATGETLDYTTVTETPGNRISREALTMMYTRYAFAASVCQEKDVLEVACGAGQALTYMQKYARRVVGGDYTESLLRVAQQHCTPAVPLVRLDAQYLPFRNQSFDVLILYEAIYYLPHPELFIAESRRVLRPGGTLLLCTVNREWADHNPSPHSYQYPSASELRDLLYKHDFEPEIRGAFPMRQASPRDVLTSLVKRLAITLHLMPKTMRGKELLKRIFFGKLVQLPDTMEDGIADYTMPVPLPPGSATSQYKVLYAVARVH